MASDELSAPDSDSYLPCLEEFIDSPFFHNCPVCTRTLTRVPAKVTLTAFVFPPLHAPRHRLSLTCSHAFLSSIPSHSLESSSSFIQYTLANAALFVLLLELSFTAVSYQPPWYSKSNRFPQKQKCTIETVQN
ncbi:hypothetical protein ACTXT7_014914 [Hymenolepis weldensis]